MNGQDRNTVRHTTRDRIATTGRTGPISTQEQGFDMAELDNELYERIGALSDAGDALMEDGDYEGALEKFRAGFDLLPEPKTNWEAGTWLMAAIGDANFLQADYAAGCENLGQAMHFPNAIGNPLDFRQRVTRQKYCDSFRSQLSQDRLKLALNKRIEA